MGDGKETHTSHDDRQNSTPCATKSESSEIKLVDSAVYGKNNPTKIF
jgi:hypothetical protein